MFNDDDLKQMAFISIMWVVAAFVSFVIFIWLVLQ
jgi:hypothetical protein